jgi:hypothetical protein
VTVAAALLRVNGYVLEFDNLEAFFSSAFMRADAIRGTGELLHQHATLCGPEN